MSGWGAKVIERLATCAVRRLRAVLAELPSASANLAVTDPLYAVRYRYRPGRIVANDDRTSWIALASTEVSHVM